MPKSLSITLSEKEKKQLRNRMNRCGLSAVDIHQQFSPRMSLQSIRLKLQGNTSMSEDQLNEVIRIIESAERKQEKAKKVLSK